MFNQKSKKAEENIYDYSKLRELNNQIDENRNNDPDIWEAMLLENAGGLKKGCKPVICYDLEHIGLTKAFQSLSSAANSIIDEDKTESYDLVGVVKNIKMACEKKTLTAYGYIWRWLDIEKAINGSSDYEKAKKELDEYNDYINNGGIIEFDDFEEYKGVEEDLSNLFKE